MQELSEFTIADLAIMHIGTYSEKEYDFALAILKALREDLIKKVNMNISMDKKYTLAGKPFTVLTVTKPGRLPVLGYATNGVVYYFTEDGCSGFSSSQNLVEVSPYADFVIDEKVMVRDHDNHSWARRYFAGINKEGKALAWDSGATQWSTVLYPPTAWNQCRRPTAEELAK